jgi:hypothetical protein
MDRSMRIRINDYMAHGDSPVMRVAARLQPRRGRVSIQLSRGLQARAEPRANDSRFHQTHRDGLGLHKRSELQESDPARPPRGKTAVHGVQKVRGSDPLSSTV